jgi:hypothetical protein
VLSMRQGHSTWLYKEVSPEGEDYLFVEPLYATYRSLGLAEQIIDSGSL